MNDPVARPRHAKRLSRHANIKPRSLPFRIFVTLSVIIGTILTGSGITFLVIENRLDNNIERVDDPFANLTNRPPIVPPVLLPGQTAPDNVAVNILLVGTDSRIDTTDPAFWTQGGQRTDAILLVHIPADRQGAFIFSIPRDSWVPIPGHSDAKINSAYSTGGPALLIETVETLTGVRIDHLAISNFDSFTEVTDALGGVEIYIPKAFSLDDIHISAGLQTLDGEESLAYVRNRKSLIRGDFDRVLRQQNWLNAIMNKALSQDTLTDPNKLLSFLEAVTKSVAVDEGFSIREMQALGISMRNIRGGDVDSRTVPFKGTGTSPGGASIVVLDMPKFNALMQAVANDTVAQYLLDNPDVGDPLTEDIR